MTSTYPDLQAFSGDGRYSRSRNHPRTSEEGGMPTRWSHADGSSSFLTVWDTQTGKVLKTWTAGPYAAFSPTRPLLAVLERNGDSTRIGFWDFAAEVEKK